ncbi:MAG: hypothetical protein AB7U82_01500 [Blastocatellales bacterium]
MAQIAFLSLVACDGPARTAGQNKSTPTVIPVGVVAALLHEESKFDHERQEHKRLLCNQCHIRDGRDPANPIPARPYHDACAKCHARENFLEASSKSPLCVVCHGKGEILNVQESLAVADFPKTLSQFGLKQFSHQTHLDPNKMPAGTSPLKCGDCHRFDNRMVVASFPRHQECYSCHVHSAEQKLSGCGDCHADAASAMRLDKSLGAATHQYNFKHSSHLNQPSIKSDCAVCHKINSVTDATRSDIVRGATSQGQRHQSACWNCHVQAREPVCAKCHLNGFPAKL